MNKEIVSIVSVIANLILSLLKIGFGLVTRSSALIAEGLHSTTDIVSSLISFLGIKIAKKKPTKTHPYGWQRAEVLAGFMVSLFLALAGLEIVWNAVKEIVRRGNKPEITFLALLVMVISAVTNEILARLKMRVGQKEDSLALIADAKHSRVDVVSSLGVLFGLYLARFFPVVDGLVALLIGLYILWETGLLGREVTENLLDVANLETEKKIKAICRQEQISLAKLRTRKIGSLALAELEIVLPVDVKISRADDLISELQASLIKRIPQLEYVIVQIKGKGERVKMLRGKCSQSLERMGPEKNGYRVIEPYKKGKRYDDFGAPEYLVIDFKNGREILKKIIANPYYKIGRGHGVQFAKAVQADEIRTINIGENAKKALKKLKIKLKIVN